MTHGTYLWGYPWFAWFFGLGMIFSIGFLAILDGFSQKFESVPEFSNATFLITTFVISGFFAFYAVFVIHP